MRAAGFGLIVVATACTPLEDSSEPDTSDVGRLELSDAVPLANPAGPGSQVPHLAVTPSGGVLLTWLEPEGIKGGAGEGDEYALKLAEWADGTWSEPTTIRTSDRLFVNWADFPSAVRSGETTLAHWLSRGDQGGYDYEVQVFAAEGSGWGSPRRLHQDTSPTEHGFVSMTPQASGGVGAIWLDGGQMIEGGTGAMQLRFASLDENGVPGPETVLDDRTCECCQTDLARGPDGLIAVYRDRSEAEIRDIALVRQADGRWTDPVIVSVDGWEMPGCPVNGPALATHGEVVAVAWFTAPDRPRVRVAFSMDGGATFDAPHEIDQGAPTGRVDIALLKGAESPVAVVTWIEERRGGEGDSTNDASSAEAAIMGRVVTPSVLGEARELAPTTRARSSGFPQIIPSGDELLMSWTDVEEDRIRTARVWWQGGLR